LIPKKKLTKAEGIKLLEKPEPKQD